MFEFLDMLGSHEERSVARYEDEEGCIVDTCAVNDSDQPYETGILHPCYNDNKWVIVQMYETHKESEVGHGVWVATMTADELPEGLEDVATSTVAKLLRVITQLEARSLTEESGGELLEAGD